MKRSRLVLAASVLGLAGWSVAGFAQSGSPSSGTTPPPPATTAPFVPPVPQPEEKTILGGVTQLTHDFAKAGEGYFSPDMKWIIFQAAPKGEQEYQMYVAPLELAAGDEGKPGSIGKPIRISPPQSRNTCGFFSPDGKDLIFASTAGKDDPATPSAGFQRQGGNYRWAFPEGMEIYRARNWHDVIQSLPADDPHRLAKPENRLTENKAYDAEGAYSPDGKHICFTSFRSGDGDVWVMNSDGSHPVQITNVKGYDGGPFFSPDGKRLVYRSDRKGNDLLQVFVADLAFDGQGNITGVKEEHQLTNDENVNWGPYWYPDGKHLIFATSRHGHQNYELYTIRDDGSHPTRITYCEGFDGLPVFSPDGKYLMWSSKRAPDNTTQLFLARFHPPKDW